MRRRCNNPNSARYAEYGGRGIKVCERWNNSFEDYYLDIDALGPKPGPEYTIDRINNDGDYEPGNVRWASKTQQNLNQRLRRDNPSGYKGVTYERGVRHWVAKFGYGGTMHTIGRFFTLEEAAAARESVMQQLFGIEASN